MSQRLTSCSRVICADPASMPLRLQLLLMVCVAKLLCCTRSLVTALTLIISRPRRLLSVLMEGFRPTFFFPTMVQLLCFWYNSLSNSAVPSFHSKGISEIRSAGGPRRCAATRREGHSHLSLADLAHGAILARHRESGASTALQMFAIACLSNVRLISNSGSYTRLGGSHFTACS